MGAIIATFLSQSGGEVVRFQYRMESTPFKMMFAGRPDSPRKNNRQIIFLGDGIFRITRNSEALCEDFLI
jgi:hypothetical protein